MSIPNPRIQKFRGDTWRIVVQVVDYDLTGATFRSMARPDHDATTGTLAFVCTPNLVTGEVVCVAAPATTQQATAPEYVWDVEMTEADGTVTTIARAVIEVLKDVSRDA